MSNIAVNDQGDTVEYNGREWVPVRSAVNDEGSRVQFVGGQWQAAPQPVPNTPSGIHAKHLADSHNPNVRAQGQAKLDEAQRPLSAGFSAAGDYVSGLADQFVQGVTFSHGDEIKAAAQTARDWITGGDGNYSDYVAQNRADLQQFKDENSKAAIASEMVGAVATGAGLPKLLAKQLPGLARFMLPRTAGGAAATGATEGVLYGIGTGEGFDESLENAVVGGATGAVAGPLLHGVGELTGRALRNAPGLDRFKWKPEGNLAQRNIQTAKDLGFELTPAQRTGNYSLEQIEAGLQRNPGGVGIFKDQWDNNQALSQRTANKSLGIDGVEVDLGRAKQVNSALFKQAESTGDKIQIDRQFVKDIAQVKRDYSRAWGKVDKSRVFKDIREEIDKGSITATRYQYLSSRLSDDINRAAVNGDGGLVRLYGGLQRALDKAADRSIPESNKVFHKAREAFRTRKMLEKPNVVNAATGEISIPRMANSIRRDTNGYVHGFDQTPLYNIARMSDAYKNSIPNSGTPSATPSAIPWAPFYKMGSSAYKAIPMGMFGSSGAGKVLGRANPAVFSGGLDFYQDESK